MTGEELIPFIPIMLILGFVLSGLMALMQLPGGDESNEDTPVPGDDQSDAEQEIKMRFARGEITSETYTEMMARL